MASAFDDFQSGGGGRQTFKGAQTSHHNRWTAQGPPDLATVGGWCQEALCELGF